MHRAEWGKRMGKEMRGAETEEKWEANQASGAISSIWMANRTRPATL